MKKTLLFAFAFVLLFQGVAAAQFDITGGTQLGATDQSNYLYANEEIQFAQRSGHAVLSKAVTAGANTITESELNSAGTFWLTGTPAGAVTVTIDNKMGSGDLDRDRRPIVCSALSDSSVITVDTFTGSATTPAIAQNECWQLQLDANEIIIAENLAGGGGSVSVDDQGSEVVAAATTFDFIGAGVTASDGGAGTATITIPGGVGGGGGGGAWDPIETQTASASASLDFVFPAGYRDFEISGCVDLSADADLWGRISTDGGSSFDLAGGDYSSGGRRFVDNGSADFNGADVNQYLFASPLGGATDETACFDIRVLSPGDNAFTSAYALTVGHHSAGNATTYLGGGKHEVNAVVDAFQILPSTGNFASGSATLWGKKTDPGGELIVRYSPPSGTGGGNTAAGSYVVRPLNASADVNTIANATCCTSNRVTLPAGDYEVEGFGTLYDCGTGKNKIYDTTGTADLVIGMSVVNSGSGNGANEMPVNGTFNLSASSDLEIRSYCGAAITDGLGVAASAGDVEVYTWLKFTKK